MACEGHSKSGIIFFGLLIGFFVIMIMFVVFRGKSDNVSWTNLKIKSSKENYTMMEEQPLTIDDAIEKGWKQVSSNCSDVAK